VGLSVTTVIIDSVSYKRDKWQENRGIAFTHFEGPLACILR
jgi:hypothetical protein